MAKNQVKSTYNLYLRGQGGPTRNLTAEEKASWRAAGKTPPAKGSVLGTDRHHLVETFERYHQLIARAKQLCVELNWPITRWMEIFDWNQT